MVAPFENLTVWQLAHDLALRVYKITSTFPTQEQYGVVAQMRRAAVSIPANIAEGNARGSRADYLRFCHIARGSVAEMKNLLGPSQDLGLLSFEEYCNLIKGYDRLSALLQGLIDRLASKRLDAIARLP